MSHAAALPIPGLVHGRYPERRRPLADAPGADCRRFAQAVGELLAGRAQPTEADCVRERTLLRQLLARFGFDDAVLQRAVALIAELATLRLGLAPHAAQLMAARALLDRRLVEMPTGEGKTLAAAIAAAAAALARIPVHVVTANEYLARRDAEWLAPLYRSLGLRVGVITHELGASARRRAYACDVVYCTAKELVFDYLRDSLARGGGARDARPVLRGLCMALIDEADSVLLDEARVPFILSRSAAHGTLREHYERALHLARELSMPMHFAVDVESRRVELTSPGREKCEREAPRREALWRIRRYREEMLCQALAALHLFERDRHYVVRDGAVHIVDETTGRIAAGRAWSRGLHQLIEIKEGCAPSAEHAPAAQITYQSFFTRYLHLCGMSGTLIEARRELAATYGMRVTRVPPRRPARRMVLPTRVFATDAARWSFVVARAAHISRRGGAVLVGTDSVGDSQRLSAALAAARLEHVVLNARQDRHEAEVVARAAEPGRITVATSMAGRGTDIALSKELARAGGLHVILCQANASARIDRQFLGRCARRGEPGSCETLLSLEAPAIAGRLPRWLRDLTSGELRPRWLARLLARFPLWLEGRRERRLRRELARQDAELERQPIWGGAGT